MFDSFHSLIAVAFDEIEAKTQFDKWVDEGGTYLMWEKGWKHIDGGMHRK